MNNIEQNEETKGVCDLHGFCIKNIAIALDKAGYRKQSETVKEFAEQLKKDLFAKCVVIQTISNPQKEDMDSSEAFQIIDNLAEQYGKEKEVEK